MNVYTAMMPRALWSVSRTTQHISCLIRGFAAAPSASCDVFDGALKSVQRDRASSMVNGMDAVADHRDPLADKVAARLVERLEDCTRPFPRALILGGSTLQVLRRLAGGVGGVETAVVVDTSPGMLAKVANEMSNGMGKRPSSMPHVEKLVLADPLEHEALPVDPSSFDVCISSLALHWVNDVPGIMSQCRKALRPDGLFLATLFGGQTVQELRMACTIAQLEREGGVSPRTSPLVQVRDSGNLLTRAGFTLPTVDVDDIVVHYPDVLSLVQHLREMGETNALKQRRESLPRDTALAAAVAYHHLFSRSELTSDSPESSKIPEPIQATFQIMYLTGWSPDPANQPKSAQRGSATLSLKDLQDLDGAS